MSDHWKATRCTVLTLVAPLAVMNPAAAAIVACTFPDGTFPAEKDVTPYVVPQRLAFEANAGGSFKELGRSSLTKGKREWEMVDVKADIFVLASPFRKYVISINRTVDR